MKQQATAKLNSLRMSPRKVRLVINLIRHKSMDDAFIQLQYSKKDAARPIMKLLRSAIANAEHNHQMDTNSLQIVEAYVDGGPVLKRWMPRAMGRATPLRKRSSHITIVLEGVIKETKKITKVKKEKVPEAEQKENKKMETKKDIQKKVSIKK